MQKTLKRTLSLLLVVVMVAALFTALPITASAADEETIAVGETKTISISEANKNDTVYLKFVPDKDMMISFYSSSENVYQGPSDHMVGQDPLGYIYDEDKNQLAYDDDSGADNNFNLFYAVTAGTTYYLGVKYDNYNKNYDGFTVSLKEPETIALDETKEFTVTSKALYDRAFEYYQFTPEKGMFISLCDPDKDGQYAIYNSEGNSLADGNHETPATCYVEGGKTYVISVGGYHLYAGSFTVKGTLTKGEGPAIIEDDRDKYEDEYPLILGTSVTLDDFIRLNVYIDTKGLDCGITVQNLDAEVGIEGDARLQGNVDYEIENIYQKTDWDVVKLSIKVYAKEMADRFKIYVKYDDYSTDITTSVKAYMEAIINDPEKYAPIDDPNSIYGTSVGAEELKNLCCATLNYGAAAQKQFRHVKGETIYDLNGDVISSPTVPYANENVPAEYKATEEIVVGPDEGSTTDFSDLGLEYYASSLGLFDNTSYAICFEQTGNNIISATYKKTDYINVYMFNASVGTAHYKDTDENGNVNEYSHDMVAYYIDGIAAKDILNDFEVTLSSGDKTQTVKFSPKTYIYKVLERAGVEPEYKDSEYVNAEGNHYFTYNTGKVQSVSDLTNTVTAIYDYSTRAAKYFNAIKDYI